MLASEAVDMGGFASVKPAHCEPLLVRSRLGRIAGASLAQRGDIEVCGLAGATWSQCVMSRWTLRHSSRRRCRRELAWALRRRCSGRV